MRFYWIPIFILISFPNATTYYVAPGGVDDGPGTFINPWGTIQHAAEELAAGDTVLIRGGVYNEQVMTLHDGSAAAGHIVFMAYPGEIPIIDGTGVTTGNNGIIIGHSYIKLLGLHVRNWNDNGIWVVRAGNIEISDCEVYEVGHGIGFSNGAHDFVLNRVLIHHFDLYGFDASPDGDDCYNGVLNDCIAHTGRDHEQNVDGFGLGHGTQHDFIFNRCITYDVFDGFDISSRKATLNRCLAHDCWNGCYKLWQDSVFLYNCIGYNAAVSIVELDWDSLPGRTTLTNCTFFNSQAFAIWIENSADTLFMTNCIIAGSDNIGLCFELPGVGNYHGDYNIFHTDDGSRVVVVGYMDEFTAEQVEAGEWRTYSGQDLHSIIVYHAESVFVDPAMNNLHLLPTSPAVDHGTASGAPGLDFDGNARPYGSGYDIGAYEYSPGGIVNEFADRIKFPVIQISPNPFNSSCQIQVPVGAQIEIYDLRGNIIFSPFTPTCGQGVSPAKGHKDVSSQFVHWGKMFEGQRGVFVWHPDETIPSGAYFVKATIYEQEGTSVHRMQTAMKRIVYLK